MDAASAASWLLTFQTTSAALKHTAGAVAPVPTVTALEDLRAACLGGLQHLQHVLQQPLLVAAISDLLRSAATAVAGRVGHEAASILLPAVRAVDVLAVTREGQQVLLASGATSALLTTLQALLAPPPPTPPPTAHGSPPRKRRRREAAAGPPSPATVQAAGAASPGGPTAAAPREDHSGAEAAATALEHAPSDVCCSLQQQPTGCAPGDGLVTSTPAPQDSRHSHKQQQKQQQQQKEHCHDHHHDQQGQHHQQEQQQQEQEQRHRQAPAEQQRHHHHHHQQRDQVELLHTTLCLAAKLLLHPAGPPVGGLDTACLAGLQPGLQQALTTGLLSCALCTPRSDVPCTNHACSDDPCSISSDSSKSSASDSESDTTTSASTTSTSSSDSQRASRCGPSAAVVAAPMGAPAAPKAAAGGAAVAAPKAAAASAAVALLMRLAMEPCRQRAPPTADPSSHPPGVPDATLEATSADWTMAASSSDVDTPATQWLSPHAAAGAAAAAAAANSMAAAALLAPAAARLTRRQQQLQQQVPDVCRLLGGPCSVVAWLGSSWEQAPVLVTPGDTTSTPVAPGDAPSASSQAARVCPSGGGGHVQTAAPRLGPAGAGRGAAAAVGDIHQGEGAAAILPVTTCLGAQAGAWQPCVSRASPLGLGAAELWGALLPRCCHCPPPPAGRVDPLQYLGDLYRRQLLLAPLQCPADLRLVATTPLLPPPASPGIPPPPQAASATAHLQAGMVGSTVAAAAAAAAAEQTGLGTSVCAPAAGAAAVAVAVAERAAGGGGAGSAGGQCMDASPAAFVQHVQPSAATPEQGKDIGVSQHAAVAAAGDERNASPLLAGVCERRPLYVAQCSLGGTPAYSAAVARSTLYNMQQVPNNTSIVSMMQQSGHHEASPRDTPGEALVVEQVVPLSAATPAAIASVLTHQGVTLVLHDVTRRWWGAAGVAEQLEALTGLAAGANLYASPAGGHQGLAAHYDDHDVLVVQSAGAKAWLLQGPRHSAHHLPLTFLPRHPVQPLVSSGNVVEGVEQLQLQAGQVLYLPRGWAHQVAVQQPLLSSTECCDQAGQPQDRLNMGQRGYGGEGREQTTLHQKRSWTVASSSAAAAPPAPLPAAPAPAAAAAGLPPSVPITPAAAPLTAAAPGPPRLASVHLSFGLLVPPAASLVGLVTVVTHSRMLAALTQHLHLQQQHHRQAEALPAAVPACSLHQAVGTAAAAAAALLVAHLRLQQGVAGAGAVLRKACPLLSQLPVARLLLSQQCVTVLREARRTRAAGAGDAAQQQQQQQQQQQEEDEEGMEQQQQQREVCKQHLKEDEEGEGAALQQQLVALALQLACSSIPSTYRRGGPWATPPAASRRQHDRHTAQQQQQQGHGHVEAPASTHMPPAMQAAGVLQSPAAAVPPPHETAAAAAAAAAAVPHSLPATPSPVVRQAMQQHLAQLVACLLPPQPGDEDAWGEGEGRQGVLPQQQLLAREASLAGDGAAPGGGVLPGHHLLQVLEAAAAVAAAAAACGPTTTTPASPPAAAAAAGAGNATAGAATAHAPQQHQVPGTHASPSLQPLSPQGRPSAAASHPAAAGDTRHPSDASSAAGACCSSVGVWGCLRGDVLALLQLGAGVLLAAPSEVWGGDWLEGAVAVSPGGMDLLLFGSDAGGLGQPSGGVRTAAAAGDAAHPSGAAAVQLVQQQGVEGDGGDAAAAAAAAAVARCLVSAGLRRLDGGMGLATGPINSSSSSSSSSMSHAGQQAQEVLQLAVSQLPGMLRVSDAQLQLQGSGECEAQVQVVVAYQQHMWQQLEAAQAVRRACLAVHDLRAAQLGCSNT